MEVRILAQENSVCSEFLAELRDVNIHQDRMRFRKNLERIGEVMAYEISKTMPYTERTITTPLGTKKVSTISSQPVLATILRAGSPMHQGVLNYFDKADNCFVSAYRKEDGDELEVVVEYLACPSVEGRELIMADPMLATGTSMVLAYKAILNRGNPAHLHCACVVASPEGIDFVKQKLPENTTLWIGDVDDGLDEHRYIVPGLGDAGDLAFGEKL